ncbi:MAG: ankyrin repeat domain-containing protein [Proteobacteria bacterium]|nr:ankyrin repeat domain-containing protein [Pseudomonadota bacterium]
MNRLFSKSFFAVVAMTALLASPSIHAQIKNVYDSGEESISGITSLMSAVSSGDVDGVKFFAKSGPAVINQRNLGGATALHLACREGNFEIVKILVDGGADINLADNEGWTPLMRAALVGDKNSVDLLLTKGAKADAINSVGESALIHAAYSSCNECLISMFKNYDFSKFMDLDNLKAQLSDAFVAAKNRDNQVAQDIINAALNCLPKENLVANLPEKADAQQEKTSVQQGKKFVFKPDGKIVSVVESDLPSITKPSKFKSVTQAPKQQEEMPFVSKFKLIIGEQGKIRTKKNLSKVIKVEDNKSSVVLEKDRKVEESVIKTEPSATGSIYKFSRGPEAKIIKRKPIKKKEITSSPKEEPLVKNQESKISDSQLAKPAEAPTAPVVNKAPVAGATSKIINPAPTSQEVAPAPAPVVK